MGKFDEVLGLPDEPVDDGIVKIGGTYQCQTCHEVVYGGLYSAEHGELAWRCSTGHVSRLKEFYV